MEACCECGNKTEFVCRCKNFSFCSAWKDSFIILRRFSVQSDIRL